MTEEVLHKHHWKQRCSGYINIRQSIFHSKEIDSDKKIYIIKDATLYVVNLKPYGVIQKALKYIK